MKILAIDTSLTAVSACVFDGDHALVLSTESLPMKRGHAEALMPLVDRVVRKMVGGFSSIRRVAVTVGPGSFTGIRVGISAAQAIGLALEVEVVGVSTLAAFAAPLVIAGGEAKIVAAIDARHGNVFFQAFTAKGRTLVPAQIASAAEAAALIGEGPFRMAGSGGGALVVEAWKHGQQADPAGELEIPLIEYVARLGHSADPDHAPSTPLYLKAADVTLAPEARA